jgi:hypothetical protein
MLARDMLKQIWWVVIALFCAAAPKRFAFNAFNRLIFASLYRVAPYVLNALVITKPETVSAGIVWDFVCSGDGNMVLGSLAPSS